jgi:hypothetical protein
VLTGKHTLLSAPRVIHYGWVGAIWVLFKSPNVFINFSDKQHTYVTFLGGAAQRNAERTSLTHEGNFAKQVFIDLENIKHKTLENVHKLSPTCKAIQQEQINYLKQII